MESESSEEESELAALSAKLSPISKQQLIHDVEAHGGEANYMWSLEFFRAMLDEDKASSFFIERKKAYRAMVDGIPQRAKLMDWLLTVAT